MIRQIIFPNGLLSKIVRLNLTNSYNSSINNCLCFHTSPLLLAEPLKKKKKLDPAVIKAREDRKKKKIEKQIRRLEKNARQLKPIDECEVSLKLLDEKKLRTRKSLEQLPVGRDDLEKQWTLYKNKNHLADVQQLDKLFLSQQKALDELQMMSNELYNEAIKTDFNLLPFVRNGPLSTPPIQDYQSPDGDYVDISKKWE